jgi:hypothetical protein
MRNEKAAEALAKYLNFLDQNEVNRHVNLPDSAHPNASHLRPTETEKPQSFKITANSF